MSSHSVETTASAASRNRRPPSHNRQAQVLAVADVQTIVDQFLPVGQYAIAGEQTRRKLQAIDRSNRFSPEAQRLYQDLLARLGVKTAHTIELPLCERPFWHRTPNPLANYQSDRRLPGSADVVIIGAGLTGAAAAYHLRNSEKSIVILDQGDPAGEASGRNGGNFELLPENAVGTYEGLAPGRFTFMKRRYPHVPDEVLRAVSERQASLVLGLALRNRDLLKETILNEDIACDFSPRGWLHITTDDKEEQGVCDEVSLAAQQGQRIEIWSRAKIRDEFGINAKFLGRFIPGDGTYHPFKFVCGELQCAVRAGVALFTRTMVRGVKSVNLDEHRVITDRGAIIARRVIVATNAFTRELFPELSAIKPFQSQILVTEHVPDRARGRIVTSETGPVFFNQPRQGARDGRAPLIMGGGDDRPMKNPSSRRRSPAVHTQLLALRDSFYPELSGQPPSAEWIGPMAFTPDGLPCIGYLRPGLVIAAGYNGYGGSYTTAAGYAAADMITTDSVPDWVSEEIFSPRRLLHDAPLFLTERKGLWRIATSLCDQLQAVNHRISEALTLQRAIPLAAARSNRRISRPQGQSASTDRIDPKSLQEFSSFSKFSEDELRRLIRVMKLWDLRKDSVIFTEGSLGGTCFLIVDGSVNVSVDARGRHLLLATLPTGSIFGQVSIIKDVPRSATCTAHTDAVLLEIGQPECKRLLRSGTSMALKFLSVLNQGLVSALRTADRRLIKIDQKHLSLGIEVPPSVLAIADDLIE